MAITLKEAREKQGLNLEEVANKLDLIPVLIEMYENDSSNIPVDLLNSLCGIYNISLDDVKIGSTWINATKDKFIELNKDVQTLASLIDYVLIDISNTRDEKKTIRRVLGVVPVLQETINFINDQMRNL